MVFLLGAAVMHGVHVELEIQQLVSHGITFMILTVSFRRTWYKQQQSLVIYACAMCTAAVEKIARFVWVRCCCCCCLVACCVGGSDVSGGRAVGGVDVVGEVAGWEVVV